MTVGVPKNGLNTTIFPAYAGVSLDYVRELNEWNNIPRIRGGEPLFCKTAVAEVEYSPHMRG